MELSMEFLPKHPMKVDKGSLFRRRAEEASIGQCASVTDWPWRSPGISQEPGQKPPLPVSVPTHGWYALAYAKVA